MNPLQNLTPLYTAEPSHARARNPNLTKLHRTRPCRAVPLRYLPRCPHLADPNFTAPRLAPLREPQNPCHAEPEFIEPCLVMPRYPNPAPPNLAEKPTPVLTSPDPILPCHEIQTLPRPTMPNRTPPRNPNPSIPRPATPHHTELSLETQTQLYPTGTCLTPP